MTASALWVWPRAITEPLVAAGLMLFLAIPTPPPRLPSELGVPGGIVVGAALFTTLAGRHSTRFRIPPDRVIRTLTKSIVLGTSSAAEEVFWRWFVLGGLAHIVGPGPALVCSTVGFALTHVHPRAVLVHLLSGGVFGAIYVGTWSLATAIAAHSTYNVLIAIAVESERNVTADSSWEGAARA